MHHFPAGSAPLLGSEDPLREAYDPLDLDSHPVSVPASPSSVVSVHGHALSTLTMSPSRSEPAAAGRLYHQVPLREQGHDSESEWFQLMHVKQCLLAAGFMMDRNIENVLSAVFVGRHGSRLPLGGLTCQHI